MPTAPAASEPETPRRVGRSRVYASADLPARLRRWHAPRNNRWERLRVLAGVLAIEIFEPDGAAEIMLDTTEQRWIAPGRRWRVAAMEENSRFELEIHVDSEQQAETVPKLRSDLLDDAERVSVADVAAFERIVRGLIVDERRLVEGHFEPELLARRLLAFGNLSWHPLEAGAGRFAALVMRTRGHFDLAAYLGCDHAVIEATLGGALSGNSECHCWLGATLERHLHIEEELVFPAYLDAGGSPARVRGLMNEHRYLRRYFKELEQPGVARKFTRLLDGHDEKEESVIYPDVIVHLGDRARELLEAAMAQPIPAR